MTQLVEIIDHNPVPVVQWYGKKVLLADFDESSRSYLCDLMEREGMDVILADHASVVEEIWSKDDEFDLVIVDTDLPGNGLIAGHAIKREAGSHFIPLLFVTSRQDDLTLASCVEAGGDDFVTRPYNDTILFARINALLRMGMLYRQQYEEHKQLAYYQDVMLAEQKLAKSIFSSIVHQDYLDGANMQYTLSPMSIFNGDMLLAARTPSGDEYVLLGDFTGHGLTASIGTLPASEIFYAMTEKGFGMSKILSEINNRLRKLLPLGMFMATCAVEISPRLKAMSVWAGGIPDLLLRRVTGEFKAIAANNIPLGIIDSSELDFSMDYFSMNPGDRFYIYTDGVIETENSDGEMFGSQRLHDTLSQCGQDENGFQQVMAAIENFRAGFEQSDDITLLEYTFSPETMSSVPLLKNGSRRKAEVSTEWNMRLRLDPRAIREFDPRPVLTQLLMDIQGLYKHRDRLYSIITELYTNALEYGVLGLDPDLRSSSEGFSEYYLQREMRKSSLDSGFIVLDLEHFPSIKGGILKIMVEDSGNGFDCEDVWRDYNPEKHYDNGLYLVKKLCNEVHFEAPGNKVSAIYQWS